MRKRFFTDRRIELLIRFWAAGAVYFFMGWGTGFGMGSIVDFILVLGLVMAIAEMFVVNPVIMRMLNVPQIVGYLDTSVLSKVRYRLLYIFKTIFLMAVVAAVYIILNKLFIALFALPEDAIVVPGEPLLFGIIYVLLFETLERLIRNIKEKIKDVKL